MESTLTKIAVCVNKSLAQADGSVLSTTSGFFMNGVSMYPCKNAECPLLLIKLIPLTQGKYAIVDSEDYGRMSQVKWRAQKDNNNFYAVRWLPRVGNKWTMIYMHREILQPPKGLQVDHRKRYGLDNRKSNLRCCTPSENSCNRVALKQAVSGYRGVYRIGKKWMAQIKHHRQIYYLGLSNTPQEAAAIYDNKANELHGDFARLNFAL